MSNITEAMITAYVNNKLTGEALEDFEVALIEDPQLLQTVQAEAALRSGMRSVEAQRDSAGANIVWLRQPLSIAAVLVIAITGSLLLTQPQEAVIRTIQSEVQLQTMRGAGLGTEQVNVQKENALVRVDVGLGQAPYNVALRHSDSGEQFLLTVLEDQDGWVQFLVHNLPSGSYELTVTDREEEQVAQYGIQVKAD